MTPSSGQGAAAPLMGAAGVRNLFFPAIDEERPQSGEQQHEEIPTAAFAQLAVSGRPPTSCIFMSTRKSAPRWAMPDGRCEMGHACCMLCLLCAPVKTGGAMLLRFADCLAESESMAF